ncbi:hypothetical protein QYF61_003889 [Mycteria americana]|uniref:Uncharacterized protein n=1 Tax=Mycteria americana TaxID=33587 RepID=A0AAN7NL05_MYCAM|nr:hypothetical protein QYF61_003889 [Mycteria americana]
MRYRRNTSIIKQSQAVVEKLQLTVNATSKYREEKKADKLKRKTHYSNPETWEWFIPSSKWRSAHRLGSTWLGSSSVERDLGVLGDNKLNMSEQCAAVVKKANRMLGCINKGITIRDKEKRCGQAGEGPEACHMRKGRELGLFSLEKRRLRGDLITMFQYLKGGCKEDGDSLFTRSHMEKTRGNGYKLLLGRFRLVTRGKFLTMRTISHWNNHPRDVVDSPTMDTFKVQLDRVMQKKAEKETTLITAIQHSVTFLKSRDIFIIAHTENRI